MIPREPGCYILNHISSGMFYIGSSGNMYERFHVHCSHLRSGIHHNPLLQALFDEDDHLHVEYVTTIDRETAYHIEQQELDRLIDHPACLNRLNDVVRGWKPGTMPDNLRQATALRNKTLHAGQQYRLGMKHSQETKEKIRRAHLSRDLSTFRRGFTVTDETREKMRIANSRPRAKGWKNSPEALENKQAASVIRGIEHSRRVSVDGVVYHNASWAAKALGFTRRTIIVRINDPRYPDWNYVDS